MTVCANPLCRPFRVRSEESNRNSVSNRIVTPLEIERMRMICIGASLYTGVYRGQELPGGKIRWVDFYYLLECDASVSQHALCKQCLPKLALRFTVTRI